MVTNNSTDLHFGLLISFPTNCHTLGPVLFTLLSDLTTANGREVLVTTSNITPIPSLPPDNSVVDIDQIMMDMPLSANVVLSQAQEPTRKKRTYRHVTQADRNLLKEKWTEHGNEWSAQMYSQVTGIKLTMVRSLLTALRKGHSVD